MRPTLIALDADGVLLDFHLAYARAWERAFGAIPAERDPDAYWPHHRYAVTRLEAPELTHFLAHFDEPFWASVPPMPGAREACERLAGAGFELVCVTALEKRFEAARLRNLQALGFPIDRVIATGNATGERSPKAEAIAELQPAAFADDYLPYLRGLPTSVHTALILRGPNGSPNTGPDLAQVRSTHADLSDFVDHWLATARGNERR
jgi:phosphoglycolate phosphatase-like HAD superfamily hydrolase